MFPERPVKPPEPLPGWEIFRGNKAVCGVQLVVDKVWRYQLQEGEQLTVEIRDAENVPVLTKEFTSETIDNYDHIAVVELSENETALLTEDKYYITAFVDGYVVLKPVPVYVKEVKI